MATVLDRPFPSVLDAIEHALRDERDTWNPLVLHVSDLGYSIPVEAGGLCPRQLWLRLRNAPMRPLTRGELWMFRAAKEMHLDATMLLGTGLVKVAPGWKVTLVEHALWDQAGREFGMEPDIADKGQLDVEIEGPDGERVIVDWKTVRGRAIDHIDAEGASPRNVLQVRTYARKRDAVGAILGYLDREGSNFGREFPVARDDAQVVAAASIVRAIADSPVQPPILKPQVIRVENKTMDSVKIKEPWQCGRCAFLGVSCPGSMPDEARAVCGPVLANIKGGELIWKDGVPQAAQEIILRGINVGGA